MFTVSAGQHGQTSSQPVKGLVRQAFAVASNIMSVVPSKGFLHNSFLRTNLQHDMGISLARQLYHR